LPSLVTLAVLAGCSSGSGGGASNLANSQAVCTLVDRLDHTGEEVARADVKDPAAFSDALDTAVERYTEILDDLRKVAPQELHNELEQLHAAVEQYRFGDGVDAHAALDAYATRSCA
jgi:hypothetical protein